MGDPNPGHPPAPRRRGGRQFPQHSHDQEQQEEGVEGEEIGAEEQVEQEGIMAGIRDEESRKRKRLGSDGNFLAEWEDRGLSVLI